MFPLWKGIPLRICPLPCSSSIPAHSFSRAGSSLPPPPPPPLLHLRLCHCHSADTTADGAALCSGAFWRSSDSALPAGSESSKTSERPKKCPKEKAVSCLGTGGGTGACGWRSWSRAGRCQWGPEGLRISSGAVLAAWPGTPCSPELMSALFFAGKQTNPEREHFRGRAVNNGMNTGGV